MEQGWVLRCDPVQLAMLFSAMVYEPRRYDESSPPTRTMKGIATPFAMHMEAFTSVELAYGVEIPVKAPDFGMHARESLNPDLHIYRLSIKDD